jgi:hypothetical protein
MYYTGPTIWSHVTTFGHNGYIYDTTTKGVTKHHVSDYFDGNTYIAVMQSERMSEEERRAGLFRAETLVGHKFNWLGVLIFWLMIILGKEEEYRFRYSLDIIILLTFLSMLSSRFVTIQLCVNGLMFIYISIVIFNRLFSKVRSNAVL